MKFEVIGWTNYDDETYPEHQGDFGAVEFAVAEAIRRGGYRFGGDTHQGAETGTPVLNDGTRACFSFREWGYLMAEALSLEGPDGPAYMEWYMDLEKELSGDVELVLPPDGVEKSRIKKRAALAETFSVPVLPEEFEAAAAGKKTAAFFPKAGEFDRICRGDALAFSSEDRTFLCRVARTEVFSVPELFGSADGPFPERRKLLLKRARFGEFRTADALRELYYARYGKDEPWGLAVSFRPLRPRTDT